MYEECLGAAQHWRDAVTKKERENIFKETGIRWSELLRLPYWDPTRSMVVDGMHNLFLRLVQFHFRDLIIIDKPSNKELCKFQKEPDTPLDAKELAKGRKMLASKPTYAIFNRLRAPVLLKLVEEGGGFADLDSNQKRPTKKSMVDVLLSKPVQPPVPMEVDDEDVVMDDGIIGQDIVEEYQNFKNDVNKKKKAVEPLTDPEINIIQGKLRSIMLTYTELCSCMVMIH
ncbi:hypothetical protein PAXINDRAFT_16444 [Paxillus involutus ATCC 200175]|uniref:Uncharacterized protein n=1 Tax=Paxillus involutus ATCC 200175 TaxID=664439 RepID=A0A0C9T4L4_PAXIN|nr:hypothetical protein PAXINDRAFT_16444 [Paxillus involutus ATCC 200175]